MIYSILETPTMKDSDVDNVESFLIIKLKKMNMPSNSTEVENLLSPKPELCVKTVENGFHVRPVKELIGDPLTIQIMSKRLI